jgi:hypothetical protein
MAWRRTLALRADQPHERAAHRDHDRRSFVRKRCAAVLKIAAGHAPSWVARSGWLKARDPDTVDGWLARYPTAGLAGLLAHPQGGNRWRRRRDRPAGGNRGPAAAAARRGSASGGGLLPVAPAAQPLDRTPQPRLGP